MHKQLLRGLLILLPILPLASGVAALAQQYPARTVRVVVPFTPGGGTDIVARLLAAKFSESLGQQFIVDNRPGAGTVIGSEIVAKARPDGYTLIMQVNSLAANHTLYRKLPYDTLRDFAPIVLVASTPNVLVVHPSLPVGNLREFIALAKRRPGEIAYASSGVGGASFLATEMFKLDTGTQMTHIPYKGTVPALASIISGETQAMIAALPGTVPNLKAKRLRALAVTSVKRAAAMPELPTANESGVKGFEFATWYGLFAPGGTSQDIINRVNNATNKVLTLPDIKEQFTRQGLDSAGGSSEQFAAYFKNEVEKLGKVIRATGATVE
jgi:tripartite-type tricarboxylate transporter receptor subunit TctC